MLAVDFIPSLSTCFDVEFVAYVRRAWAEPRPGLGFLGEILERTTREKFFLKSTTISKVGEVILSIVPRSCSEVFSWNFPCRICEMINCSMIHLWHPMYPYILGSPQQVLICQAVVGRIIKMYLRFIGKRRVPSLPLMLDIGNFYSLSWPNRISGTYHISVFWSLAIWRNIKTPHLTWIVVLPLILYLHVVDHQLIAAVEGEIIYPCSAHLMIALGLQLSWDFPRRPVAASLFTLLPVFPLDMGGNENRYSNWPLDLF